MSRKKFDRIEERERLHSVTPEYILSVDLQWFEEWVLNMKDGVINDMNNLIDTKDEVKE